MDYIIDGEYPLVGELSVYGAKNCALALLGATVLTDDVVTLFDCPRIVDVENMLTILRHLGKKVQRLGDTVSVWGKVVSVNIPPDLSRLLRGSGLLLGGLLARYGSVFLPATGGCSIGARPMDIHFDGLRQIGYCVEEDVDGVTCCGQNCSGKYTLRMPSVGATENLLCASVLTDGQVELSNCALEPEVEALCVMLAKMGANISGIGTDRLCITGIKSLHGTEFCVIPDRIVAATYLACALATKGRIAVTKCNPSHIGAFLDVVSPRVPIKIYGDAVLLDGRIVPREYGNIVTAPYPLFPTDLQQIVLSLCALSNGGISSVCEKMFERRLRHNVLQLQKMGAQISLKDDVATVEGCNLHGSKVVATDLRGGAGLVVAALGANGQSVVQGGEHIARGYSNFADSLNSVGAHITVL